MKITLIVMLTILMSGCSTLFGKPEPVIEVRYQEIPYNVPKAFFNDCDATRPISKDRYMRLTPLERETYLSDYSVFLLKDLKNCDDKVKSIKDYLDKRDKSIGKI